MKLTLEIDGTPTSVLLSSFKIQRELSGRTSKAEFQLRVNPLVARYDESVYDAHVYAGDTDPPLPGHLSTVRISNVDTHGSVFSGYVVRVTRDQKSHDLQLWNVNCVGYELLLERAFYSGTFENKTDRYIIQSVFASSDISAENETVDELGTGIDITFKDATHRQVLERLASIFNAEWFVNADKELVWREVGSVPAPFSISDAPDPEADPPAVRWRNFSPSRDSSAFANRVVVFGGFVGDTEQTATAENSASITDIGLRPVAMTARDVTDAGVLQAMADVELAKRGVKESVTFETDAEGLDVGMLLSVNSPPVGIAGTYSVQTLEVRQWSPERTVFRVTVGDWSGDLIERLRALQAAKNATLLVPVPPPPNSISNQHISGGIHFDKLDGGTVSITNSQLAGGISFSGKIDGSTVSITNSQLAGSINFSKIDGSTVSISNSQLAGTINFSKIDGSTVSISNSQLAGSINFSKIDGSSVSISNSQLAGSINFSKIDGSSVSIANSQLAGSINFSKIDGSTVSISNSQLAGSINFSKIDNATISIVNSNIANLTITGGKLVNGTIGDNQVGSLTADKIVSGTMSVGSGGLTVTTNSFSTVISGSTMVCGGIVCASITCTPNHIDSWNGFSVFGSPVINSSRQFVGAGVLCPSNGVGAAGFNPWNGSTYDTGQTVTITSLVFRGGVLINYT